MDFISTSTLNTAEKALDGLALRSRAIASNVANVNTVGYKRVDVEFEDQLKNIINNDEKLKDAKIKNSMNVLQNTSTGQIFNEQKFNNVSGYMEMAQKSYESFSPITTQNYNAEGANGNNVSIEQEMSELNKTGVRYNALSALMGKQIQELQAVIKGGNG